MCGCESTARNGRRGCCQTHGVRALSLFSPPERAVCPVCCAVLCHSGLYCAVLYCAVLASIHACAGWGRVWTKQLTHTRKRPKAAHYPPPYLRSSALTVEHSTAQCSTHVVALPGPWPGAQTPSGAAEHTLPLRTSVLFQRG